MKNLKRALILANGRMGGWPRGLEPRPGEDLIICADGGLSHALRFGLTPDLVVGDLDSAEPEELKRLAGQGTEIETHPAEKNETDLELALLAALERRAKEIVVLGALGKRLDMTLANILLLASERIASGLSGEEGPALRLMDEAETAFFMVGPGEIRLEGEKGDSVSLMALDGPVRGLSLRGLRYPLKAANLPLGSTRGISNVIEEPPARLSLLEGGLLVVVSAEAV